MEMGKIWPLAENTWYKWCNWQIKKIKGSFNDKYIEYENASDEKLTVAKYLENIRPYLRDIIDDI